MGINIINPDYRKLLAIEKSRINSMGLHENKKHNNYTKAIISIFAVAVLLSTMGVPIYNGIYAMESNALPYDMGIVAATGNSAIASGHMGNIIYYEVYHWGQFPTIAGLEHIIIGALTSIGAAWLVAILYPVIGTFTSVFAGSIAAYGLSLSSVQFGLEYAAASVSLSVDWPTLAIIAGGVLAA